MRITLFELLYRYIYPALRRRFAIVLYREFGLKQERIAKILGITQSAVSRYVDGRRGILVGFEDIPEVNEQLRTIARRVLSGELDEYGVQVELMRVIFKLLGERRLCIIHAKVDSSIDYTKCSICPNLFKPYIKPQ
ncbi:MAG TPA: transcriptional regulator [Acidilobales archaeon]|nr:transcriptional regulator [Acidilobales archaeon]